MPPSPASAPPRGWRAFAQRLLAELALSLRALWPAEPPARLLDHAYRYADSPEHREGIAAFNQKRAPVF